jgi:hypothetical protein
LFIPADAMPRSMGSDDELLLLDIPPDGRVALLDALPEPDVPEPLELEPLPYVEPLVPEVEGELARLPELLEPLGVAVDELLPLGEDIEPVDDEPVAGDALGFVPEPTAACATRLQRSKSAWVGDDVCAWTVVTASSPAIETNAAVRFVLDILFLLRDGFGMVEPVGQREFKRGAKDHGRAVAHPAAGLA